MRVCWLLLRDPLSGQREKWWKKLESSVRRDVSRFPPCPHVLRAVSSPTAEEESPCSSLPNLLFSLGPPKSGAKLSPSKHLDQLTAAFI